MVLQHDLCENICVFELLKILLSSKLRILSYIYTNHEKIQGVVVYSSLFLSDCIVP